MKLATLIRTWFTLIVLMMLYGMVSCTKKDHSNPGNDLAVTITGFTPDIAWYGHTVTINGNKFSEVLSENTVTIGDVKAEIITATTTQLKVQIVQGMQSGYIHVTTKGKETVSDKQLVINQLAWQKKLGSSGSASALAIYPVAGGGYIVAGYASASDGDLMIPNKGAVDMWFAKLDSVGKIVWQNSLGGSENDVADAIAPAADGGFFIAGRAVSRDGDFKGGPGSTGDTDAWIIKVNAGGAILWKKALGGTDFDFAAGIVAAPDGGCIMAGSTASKNGDLKGSHGGYDMWVVKLDAGGNLIWQKLLGGWSSDVATSIAWDAEGGLLVAGSTSSTDGDVSGPLWGIQIDMWIVKLDAGGNLIWQKTLGGTSSDQAQSITVTPDGGCVVLGYTYSTDGNVTNAHGKADLWVVKLNAAHDITWQKTLGGSGSDWPTSILTAPGGGWVVTGYTDSNDGDVSGNHGKSDIWMATLDTNGKMTGQRMFGGSDDDNVYGNCLVASADNGYMLAGSTSSTNGDVTDPRAGTNIWILKVWE